MSVTKSVQSCKEFKGKYNGDVVMGFVLSRSNLGSSFFLISIIYLFTFWLRQVLAVAREIIVEACGIFCCNTRSLRCSTRASL